MQNNFTDFLSRNSEILFTNQINLLKSDIYAQLQGALLDDNGSLANIAANRRILKKTLNQVAKVNVRETIAFREIVKRYDEYLIGKQALMTELGYDDLNVETLKNVELVRIMQNWTMNEVGGKSEIMTADIKKTFNKSIFGVQTIDKLVDTIGGKWDSNAGAYKGGLLAKYKSHAFTVANTGLMMTDRAVGEAVALQHGVEWFEPSGVTNDGIIRPFCYAVMHMKDPNSNGKIPYSRKAKNYPKWYSGLKDLPNEDGYVHYSVIQRLNNGQIKNVMLSFGGYNCRHGWNEAIASINRELIKRRPDLSGVMPQAA